MEEEKEKEKENGGEGEVEGERERGWRRGGKEERYLGSPPY